MFLFTNYYMNSNFDIPVEKLNEPGNIWIRPQNKQLRYSTNADTAASWLNPLPVYKASKEIKFGQPVSLTNYSQEHSITESGTRVKTIMPTNAIDNSSFIGIAIEYGEKTKDIHILNNGELVYEISKKDNPKYWLPPYHKNGSNFVFDWTDEDVGSTVYITVDGAYTLNVDEVSGGNIMSVGKLVFAPKATETKEKQQKIIIHIQAGGDDRGVKDTAQFTVQMSSTIKPTSIESDYDRLIFVKVNKNGLGEIIFNDSSITSDIDASPVGAIMVKSKDGLCDLTPIIGKKITLVRMGLISGNFGFSPNNVGKIGLLNNGKVSFSSASDYNLKVGIFKSYKNDIQDFLIDCRFPLEGAALGDKIGTIKPVFGPSDDPLLDIGYTLVDREIHRTTFIRNDPVDKSGINWEDLIKNCYTKDIFEFGRKIGGQYVFSRVLEDFNGKSWSLDIFDTDKTVAILSPETFFRFRNLYYTINSTDGIKQVACQIKFSQDSLNTNEECIWPEEAYKIKLKATSDKEDYVLGGKGPKSTLFCNISRLVAIGNYMDGNGSNIETYDITVKVQSTGRILSPGFYQNKDGKWCGFEWFIYSNNGLTYLYMSTIPSGIEAKDCNGINTIIAGEKLKPSDPEETLIVTVRRRPTLYNAVYLNQYPVNNPWMPYVDGNTGNLITENTIYFGTPSKLLSQNQTGEDDETTSGMEFNETGRNGKIELTTEDSGKVINLSTQVRGSSDTPIFKDKKQVIKSDGSVSNTIEWEYDFASNVTSLNSYFAPILISRNSLKNDIETVPLSYKYNDEFISTTDFNEYLTDNSVSAIEILDSFYFRNIKYTPDSKQATVSILVGDDSDSSRELFPGLDISANNYLLDVDKLSPFKDFLYVDGKYIDYMSFMSLIGLASKNLYTEILKLKRIIHGDDFASYIESSSHDDNSLSYINDLGLLRTSGYLKNSLILINSQNLDPLELVDVGLPNNHGYISLIDRYIIDNFYFYRDGADLEKNYIDYRDKNYTERLQLVFDYIKSSQSNTARMYIAYNDLDMKEYSYRVYDFFKFLKDDNSYLLTTQNVYQGNTISADKIVFRKNVSGYESLCKNKDNYSYKGLVTESTPKIETYVICDDNAFNASKEYYSNVGNRVFVKANVTALNYAKNKYYVKKTIDNQYQGYPFRWPLYKDNAFNDLDVEYNFFSKNTYGLDDSLSIYDNNDNEILSSFSSQSLEGITFDTIAKLSFLYSCFDKNHTFDSKMTWLLPFIIDDGKNYKYELKRLSQTKAIDAVDNKTYSAFITKDNKIIELGSLTYNAYKFMFFESNAFNDTDTSLIDYTSKFTDWRGEIINDRSKNNGIKTTNSIEITIDLGDNKTYKFYLSDDVETYRKFIFLMTQGKLARIKNLLENDPYNAYKTYGDFFKKDYLISIDISTPEGVDKAKTSISNYLYSGISDEYLKLLAKFSITPVSIGPNENYNQLGSYSTIVSEIKSLRLVEDATLGEVQKFFTFVTSFNNPTTGSKDNLNGNSAYKTLIRIQNDLEEYDGYYSSNVVNALYFNEQLSSSSRTKCKHARDVYGYIDCTQTAFGSTQSKFTLYNINFTSKPYQRIFSGCEDCIAEGKALANTYKNVYYVNNVPKIDDTSIGSFSVTVRPTSLAQSEADAFMKQNPTQATSLSIRLGVTSESSAEVIDIDMPELNSKTILFARCKYALSLGYSIDDFINYELYKTGQLDTSNDSSPIEWNDFGIVDYARAAAYGPNNIVFYNEAAYKAFNNINVNTDLKFNFNRILSTGIASSQNIVNAQDAASLKVVWPSEINTYGQKQESLTFAKNNINQFIDRKVSDDTTTDGNIGLINIKTNPVSRASIIDENNIPDITVAELKLLLEGDEETCSKCNIDHNSIKEYNINIEALKKATLDWSIPIIELSDDVYKTLFEIQELQYQQIFENNSSLPESDDDLTESDTSLPEVLSTPVVDSSKEAIIYDLIKQGLNYDTAKLLSDGILTQGINISGGFTANPQLSTTYGLLNTELYGEVQEIDGVKYGSNLEGYVLHTYTEEDQNINDFKLKDLYNYNNIDQMVMASEKPDYEILLKNLSTIKDYIELFFSHSDKVLKDFSIIGKKLPLEIKGTTYIDDFVDSEPTNSNFSELKKSLDSINTTIQKTISSPIGGSDSFTQELCSALQSSIDSFEANLASIIKIIRTYVKDISDEDNETLAEIINSHTKIGSFTSAFKNSIINTSREVVNKYSFTLEMDKPSDMEDVKVSKAFNLEKYNEDYDREESTGLQIALYKYNKFLPEYGYLYTKPADGISIIKEVDSQEINGKVYHNNINTIVKHKPLYGEALQKESSISDKIEIKEGMYLLGEQLPLPRVSLNISPYIQNSTQRLEYKPSYENYISNTPPAGRYDPSVQQIIKIIGNFPNVVIDGHQYTINSIYKNIFTQGVFDKLPNGLKIISDVEIQYVAKYKETTNNGDGTTSENGTLSERASFHVEGPKLYRNYIYSISLSSLDSTNTEQFIISERNTTSANVTTNTSCLSPNLLPEKYRYIERFTLLKDSNSSERSLPYDLELLKEVLLNSDVFVFKPKDNSEYTKVGDEILLQWGDYGSSLPPPGVIGGHFKDEIMHISECTIDFIRN